MDNTTKKQENRTLVLYYSQTGVTKAVAEQIQKALNADIEAVEAINPYSGTYDETITRGLSELQNADFPEVVPLKSNIADYDVVFIGYPVWFGTCANPIFGLLKQYDLSGKKIVTFCTFGSGGTESSTEALRKAIPAAEVVEGYGVRSVRLAAVPEELNRFLIEGGYLEGSIEPLPPFGSTEAVIPAQVQIFDAACGDYPFPLGTPVAVASRSLKNGTEYRFTVDTADHDGNKVKGTVYVVDIDGATPEFTKVTR